MKTLFLLRHAKSNWDDPALADFDRPMNDRGQSAALAIGGYMKVEGLFPDLIMSSPAARTFETLERLQKGMARRFLIQYPKILYLAAPETILNMIHNAADSAARLMIVGHNPGLHQLALSLIKTGARPDIDNLSVKYPTGALLEITFPVETWVDIGLGGGRLQRFIKPKML